MKISYKQAREDHNYLWSIAPAYDMTGGYVESEDLDRLLINPTKATARDCYCDQIQHWFVTGWDDASYRGDSDIWLQTDPIVREIADRHGYYDYDYDEE